MSEPSVPKSQATGKEEIAWVSRGLAATIFAAVYR
jgi:hypothetical protein